MSLWAIFTVHLAIILLCLRKYIVFLVRKFILTCMFKMFYKKMKIINVQSPNSAFQCAVKWSYMSLSCAFKIIVKLEKHSESQAAPLPIMQSTPKCNGWIFKPVTSVAVQLRSMTTVSHPDIDHNLIPSGSSCGRMTASLTLLQAQCCV